MKKQLLFVLITFIATHGFGANMELSSSADDEVLAELHELNQQKQHYTKAIINHLLLHRIHYRMVHNTPAIAPSKREIEALTARENQSREQLSAEARPRYFPQPLFYDPQTPTYLTTLFTSPTKSPQGVLSHEIIPQTIFGYLQLPGRIEFIHYKTGLTARTYGTPHKTKPWEKPQYAAAVDDLGHAHIFTCQDTFETPFVHMNGLPLVYVSCHQEEGKNLAALAAEKNTRVVGTRC